MTEHNQDSGANAAHGGREPLRAPEAKEKIAHIPKAVIKRLSLYTRVLQQLEWANVEKVSSQELAEQLGLNSAQVRKDLAYFGQFGVPGAGLLRGRAAPEPQAHPAHRPLGTGGDGRAWETSARRS